MLLWRSPIPLIQKCFNFLSENLSEMWMFSTAVYVVWHPPFPERLHNTLVVAGIMSIASALIRLKKLDKKLDEMRTTQLMEMARRKKKKDAEQGKDARMEGG